MKVFSLFSGIGAFEKALTNLGIEFETVGFSEIDKYAVKSYCAIHGVAEGLNLGDITKIDLDNLPECDLITHGSPCQDFSVAGKGAGGDVGTETRSSLMWNSVEIIRRCKPKYVVWENVKNVLSKKHKHNFDKYIDALEEIGYRNFYKVLNAKDYGVPQNRERIFVISIRNDIEQEFEFPEPFDNGIRLKDVLESEVDEKFYISSEKAEKLLLQLKDKQISNTVRSSGRGSLDRHTWDMVCIGNVNPSGNEINGIPWPSKNSKGYKVAQEGDGIIIQRPWSVGSTVMRQCANTIRAGNPSDCGVVQNYRIRKLTPLECFRLMGFTDEDFQKCVDTGISNSQLYKQAGNSIVVNVLECIFKNLFNGGTIMNIDEMVKALRWLKKCRICQVEVHEPCGACEFHGMCTDPDSDESIAEQIEMFGYAADQLEQLQAENEQLKAGQPVRCGECIYSEKYNEIFYECKLPMKELSLRYGNAYCRDGERRE